MSTAADTGTNVTSVNWSMSAATRVLTVDAPEDQWLAERRKGIGGSDSINLLNLDDSPYYSPYKLWMDKTGRAKPQPQNNAMKMGKLLEPVIGELFREETGLRTRRAGLMRSKTETWMQVTLDGLCEDGGILEKKTTTKWTDDAAKWLAGEVPDAAEVQSQWGLAVTGRSHCWAMVLIDGRDYRLHRIERNQDLIDFITQLGRDFWTNNVLADVPPPIDDAPATAEAVRHRFAESFPDAVLLADAAGKALVDAYRVAKAEAAAAEDRAEFLATQLTDLLGRHEILKYDGKPIISRKQNGNFVESSFVRDEPELAAEFMRYSLAVDLDKIKTERPDLYRRFRSRALRLPKLKTN